MRDIETEFCKVYMGHILEESLNEGPIVGVILPDRTLKAHWTGMPGVIFHVYNQNEHEPGDHVWVGKGSYLFNMRTKGKVILKDNMPFFPVELMEDNFYDWL